MSEKQLKSEIIVLLFNLDNLDKTIQLERLNKKIAEFAKLYKINLRRNVILKEDAIKQFILNKTGYIDTLSCLHKYVSMRF